MDEFLDWYRMEMIRAGGDSKEQANESEWE